jgi:hypothetical protein
MKTSKLTFASAASILIATGFSMSAPAAFAQAATLDSLAAALAANTTTLGANTLAITNLGTKLTTEMTRIDGRVDSVVTVVNAHETKLTALKTQSDATVTKLDALQTAAVAEIKRIDARADATVTKLDSLQTAAVAEIKRIDARADATDTAVSANAAKTQIAQNTANVARAEVAALDTRMKNEFVRVDGKIDAVADSVNDLRAESRKGVAGAAALAQSMPSLAPGERAMSIGGAGYGGYGAVAATYAYASKTGATFSGGIATGGAGAIARAGVAWKF